MSANDTKATSVRSGSKPAPAPKLPDVGDPSGVLSVMEEARLDALRDYWILDTAIEPMFDDLTRLAAQIADTPIAHLAFLDHHRQWNKSRVGWDIGQIPLHESFATHALIRSEMVVIPDLRGNEKFAANPYVAGAPNLRFYAGVPLVADSGHVIGALCVLDEKVRAFSEQQIAGLRILARQAMALMGQRRDILVLTGEVTIRSDAEERANRQARRDVLTGLPNRTLFAERVEDALQRARDIRAKSGDKAHGGVAMLFVDLDRFKRINDTLGHAAGDVMLREVAARFTGALRPEDMLARIGGDEFTVLLPDLPTANYAAIVSQMLQRTLVRPISIQNQEFTVGASIGIAVSPRDGDDAATLLKHADIAMYQAKAKGGYQSYDPQMNADSYQRLIEESELRRAIERDELSLHYQPLIEMRTGRVVAVEALCRWRHPERGPVPPAHFIQVAEQADLIVELGEWVLRRACMDAAAWRKDGHTDLRVSVNISARHIVHGTVLSTVNDLLAEFDLPGDVFDIEITETALCTTGDTTPQTLQGLRSLGVRLSVDDFGTGYSSLAYLRRFPVDILKIDRAFIAGLDKNTPDEALVRASIEMAHALDLLVVAEGVETGAQRDCLRALGCDIAQGFLFSRPVSPEILKPLIAGGGMRTAMLLTSGAARGDVARLNQARSPAKRK
ncbi:MAG: EAL domain-containing protein [Akkermansiaceae bacterium]|nr:EAL domain-containing protein [Armatimonadota bacterium]